ncbi:izumo sperm-egg fusion protein 4-like isoform X2 [Scyliorhinus canicula]|uniref:izumo sperm-egg fusion protein 4-like isoform X2 n=1 Tax=Scyliorhinus canicula TaxID=7830 RepID=UPI0018F6A5E5|nr:izumo sperm-egg fusion protein 4-like isoform X2 [Scyliorhinus canicula]
MVQELMIASSFLSLLTSPQPAHCCLQCDSNFTAKFSYYRRHLWGRSNWAGDLIYCQNFIDSWVNEIRKTREELWLIAQDVYRQMDQQYKLSHTGIGYFPKALQRIKRSEETKVNEAIKFSFLTCSEHCGTRIIDYIDCANCEIKPVECGKRCSGIGHRGLLNPVNDTEEAKRQLTAKSITLILLPIFIAIFLFVAAFGCFYYCMKRRKKKSSEGKRKMSKSREQDLTGNGNHKSRHSKRRKHRKNKFKQEITGSTE